jgi:competence CoiA-like predicted nuclease
MYKAIQNETREEIIILHPAWRSKIEQLRVMDKADLLVCQGCGQPLRVKAGEVKRPHFAHKHLKACLWEASRLQF